jgi:hypothetical protein
LSSVVYTFRRKLLDYGSPIPGSSVVVVVVDVVVDVVVGAAVVVVVAAAVVVVAAAVVVVAAAVVVVAAAVEGCNVLRAGMIMMQYPHLGYKSLIHSILDNESVQL